jgi:hypothetical protein
VTHAIEDALKLGIRTAAASFRLSYFLTLTLDPKQVPNKKLQIPYLRKVFNKFREYLK